MFSPVIDQHVYEGQDYVWVNGVDAGVTVKVFSTAQRRRNPKLGEAQSFGESVIVSVNALKKDESIYAVAYQGAGQSNPSEKVTVQPLPPDIPKPLTSLTLYEGATCLYAWGLLPGSTVKVWSGTDDLGEGKAYLSWIFFLPLSRPLKTSDTVQLEASLSGKHSGPTSALSPVPPRGSGPFAEKLPPPRVKPPLLPCMNVAALQGLLPGAHFQVFDRAKGQPDPGSVVYYMCAPELNPLVLLGKTLEADDEIKARQDFPALKLESGFGKPLPVQKPEHLTDPAFQQPIYAGFRSVKLYRLFPNAKVEIAVFDGSQEVFKASRTFQNINEFDLGQELQAGWVVKAQQFLCGQLSGWGEAPVLGFEGELLAPVVEEPLYACANLVRIANRQEGATVTVYVDKVYAGEAAARLVPVAPHLIAGQKVTAIQSIGKVHSQESKPPVTVKETEPPKPVLSIPKDYRSVQVANLLPGAQVEIKEKNLTIGSKEAVDPIEMINLDIEPWPGMQIYARQSLCAKFAESKPVKVQGKIAVEKISRLSTTGIGIAPKLGLSNAALATEAITVHVRTQLPVKQDLKVRLISSDPAIAPLIGSDERIIPAGAMEASFSVLALETGVAYLTLEAQDYQQAFDTSGWNIDVQDPRYELIIKGMITITSSKEIWLEQGGSKNLTIQAQPRPPDGNIILQNWPDTKYGAYITKVITIPANTTLTYATFEALETGFHKDQFFEVVATRAMLDGSQPPKPAKNDWLMIRNQVEIARYEPAVYEIWVKGKAKSLPPYAPYNKTISLYPSNITLAYEQSGYESIVDGTLLGIENKTSHALTLFRTDASIFGWTGLSLKPYDNITVSIPDATDLLNKWRAKVTDVPSSSQIGDWPSVVDITIYYK